MLQSIIKHTAILFFFYFTIFTLAGVVQGQPAEVPGNLTAWHAGDGDARDFTGANDGWIVFPNVKYIVGKVGQAFAFDFNSSGGGVQLPASVFRGQSEGTIETWVRLRDLPVGLFGHSAIWAETEQNRTTRFGIFYNRNGQLAAFSNFSNISAVTPAAVSQNEWLHVAAVHKAGEPLRLYVNGALAATSTGLGAAFTDAPSPFVAFGTLITLNGDDMYLRGDVDDASVYTRALPAAEIQSIYNAGTAGKRRQTATAAGENIVNVVRDATLTFAAVMSAGETTQTPLEPAALPLLPQGYAHTGLAYDISTTAAYSGNIDLCFNLPALAGEGFSRLRVLHLENGLWVDRTTSVSAPRLCGRVTNLSPFVIAENLAPTAAQVIVGGRVTDGGGKGIYRARITLTDAAGATRSATTNPFGYYRFADVPAGATYTLSAQAKQYVFTPETMVLNVSEELFDADFTAQER